MKAAVAPAVGREVALHQVIAVESYNSRQPDEIDAHLAGPGFDPSGVLPPVIACHDVLGRSMGDSLESPVRFIRAGRQADTRDQPTIVQGHQQATKILSP